MAVATTVILYLMLGFPFLIWSARASARSAAVEIDGRPRGRPGTAATVWLAVLPALLIVYYFWSGIGRLETDDLGLDTSTVVLTRPASEWGPWLFLWLSPCVGMIIGFFAGMLFRRGEGQ